MKQLIALILLTSSVSAMAQHGLRYHHHGYYPGYNYGWVAPTIIGGVIGYEIARNQTPPVIVQQPVIVQPAPVPPATVYYGQTQTCTAWNEIQTADGRIYRERTCSQ
jgi:hypothetical protein